MNSYSIGKRLALAMTAMLVLTMLLSGAYIWAIHSMDASFTRTAEVTVRKVQIGGELDSLKSDMYVAQRGYVLAAFLGDSAKMQEERSRFQDLSTQFRQKLEQVKPMLVTAEGRTQVAVMSQKVDEWLNEFGVVQRFVEAGDPYSAQKHGFSTITVAISPGARLAMRLTLLRSS